MVDSVSRMIQRRKSELKELTDNNLYRTESGKTVDELKEEIEHLEKVEERR